MAYRKNKKRFTGRARKWNGFRLDQYSGDRGGIRL